MVPKDLVDNSQSVYQAFSMENSGARGFRFQSQFSCVVSAATIKFLEISSIVLTCKECALNFQNLLCNECCCGIWRAKYYFISQVSHVPCEFVTTSNVLLADSSLRPALPTG